MVGLGRKFLLVGVVATALMTGTVGAWAQGTQAAEGQSAANQETRKTPAMRERVYTSLSEAQACAEMDDIACAMRLLTEVRNMEGLNSYEVAQLWNFYAFIYFGQENYARGHPSLRAGLGAAGSSLGYGGEHAVYAMPALFPAGAVSRTRCGCSIPGLP